MSALDKGFLYFDTARMYGDGLCERSLGNSLTPYSRDRITLATKFGIRANPVFEFFPPLMYPAKLSKKILKIPGLDIKRDVSLNCIKKSLSDSLKALKTDWIDIFFLHEPEIEDIPLLESSIEWLLQKKKEGVIRYLGLAGDAEKCIQVRQYFVGVFSVLQVEDSVRYQESSKLKLDNIPIQITYGYMRRSMLEESTSNPIESLSKGLMLNKHGIVLVSTRNVSRLDEMISLVK